MGGSRVTSEMLCILAGLLLASAWAMPWEGEGMAVSGRILFILACVALASAVAVARLRTPVISADYARGSWQRKNLDRIRAKSGQFPKPYPNGWYRVCSSTELPVGRVMSISCCGREMVAFRGEDGKVGVLHAFCPHLGTHLGHGGSVSGNHLVCPYHSWEFTADGTNKCIPYCGKDMTGSKRVNARAYEVRERLDIVFVWYHAGDKAPEYELTILDEVE
eukprot:g2082.t1